MRIALLHTANVHVATFDRIFTTLDSTVQLDHRVDTSLLERARSYGIEAVRADVNTLLEDMSSAEAVLCTCSTLGPLIDDAGKTNAAIIRIDRPLMEQACADGGDILLALCLESTRDATLNLLHDCASNAGLDVNPVVVMCETAWAFFEAGDMKSYAASIAQTILSKLENEPTITSIVLAQASMTVAQDKLSVDTGLPVRSAPILAAKRCLEVARARKGSVR